MDNPDLLIDGLIMFLAFVGLVVVHEYGHAWMANYCGDDTPRLQGRLTLDPMAHIDLLGTIILPLGMILMSASSGNFMFFGWGKPVMVNLYNFRQRRRDDILVSLAGPVMNIIAAVVILMVVKALLLAGVPSAKEIGFRIAYFSLFLCVFNLLPIPPLDGGHIMRNLIGISDERYQMLSQYSFIILLVMINMPGVSGAIHFATSSLFLLLALPFGLGG